MEHFAFVFTIFFMLLGPIKVIPAFVQLTRDADIHFKRALAIRATLIATALVLFVTLVGGTLLDRYHISLNALRIAGGLVLIIAAMNTIFRRQQSAHARPNATLLQLAASPLASPAIVPPAGVAAILIFVMQAHERPGLWEAIGIALAIMIVLNFLVMYFIDFVMKTPGLMLVLQIVGAALIFMQVCIGIEIILRALTDLGLVKAR